MIPFFRWLRSTRLAEQVPSLPQPSPIATRVQKILEETGSNASIDGREDSGPWKARFALRGHTTDLNISKQISGSQLEHQMSGSRILITKAFDLYQPPHVWSRQSERTRYRDTFKPCSSWQLSQGRSHYESVVNRSTIPTQASIRSVNIFWSLYLSG